MEAQRGGQMDIAIPNFITQNSNLVITWSSIKYAQIHINGDKTETRMKDECQTRIVGKSNPTKLIFLLSKGKSKRPHGFSYVHGTILTWNSCRPN